jgi:hypothetical protein
MSRPFSCSQVLVPTRRDFLYGLGMSIGTAAFHSLLRADTSIESASPLARRSAHHAPAAKACIFLFMEGGPSHLDTFDPKPQLDNLHLKVFQRQDRFASAMASGERYYVRSPYRFARHGQSGIAMCEHWRHLPAVADELCIYKGLQAESVNHPTACYHFNTGNRFGGDPAIGSWVTYGLGSENQNLPAFVVFPEAAFPQGGAANWSNGFLPAHYQGTALRPSGSPVLDLSPPPGVTAEVQRKNLDLLSELNRQDLARHPQQEELTARMNSYELAYRMQAAVPSALDLNGETRSTLNAYGIERKETAEFGRKCLLARKLVEAGVRFVQIYTSGWDSHDYIERSHRARIAHVDQPMTALIQDLKARGLLDSTLIVWGGEFGRSPDNGVRGGAHTVGRDHNANAMNVLLCGGGVKAGHIVGATDEIGDRAVEVVHPLKDFHVTLLHLLGLDDAELTYFDEGRFKQLSQVGGTVIEDLKA